MTAEALVNKITSEVERLTALGRNKTFLPFVTIMPNDLTKVKATLSQQLPNLVVDARRCPR